jgi:uroporphyrinogen decarboxylase
MSASDNHLAGLHVAGFEGRRGERLADLIRAHGGTAHVAAAMREVALQRNPEAVDFANRVMTGQVDVVVFTTGEGVRQLVQQVERHVDRQRFCTAIGDLITIARGPKPVEALGALGLRPSHVTAEPHTWREILQVVDRNVPVTNHVVGLQEYGEPNASLLAGLEARGATVTTLRLYHWALPEDTGELAATLEEIAAGRLDVVLFTSSRQVVNVLHLAERCGLTGRLRQAMRATVVGSIGPDTSTTLRENELAVDVESLHPTMEALVEAVSTRACEILDKRRWLRKSESTAAAPTAPKPAARQPTKLAALDRNDPCYDSLFLKACRREPVDRTPIWLMRQAGRYMAEYRAVREKHGFLELCKNPNLCAEVMITAVRRLDVDAAIIFSDLLPILEPMGLELEFSAGEGPAIHNPVREAPDVDRVRELDNLDSLEFVMETVRKTRAGLPRGIPVIGFAGAPFTLASYVIEGGASRNFLHTKRFMYGDSGAWTVLMSRLGRAVARYLNAQIAAGAHAVQIFDSWVGCLSPGDYRDFVVPHMKALINEITPGVPLIHFATGNPALVPLQAEAGGSVIGVDWRIRLDDAWRATGFDRGIQGNLDPAVLLSDRDQIRRRAKQVLDQAGGRPGHIFNLGHGVLPQTPVENVLELIEAVREFSQRQE